MLKSADFTLTWLTMTADPAALVTPSHGVCKWEAERRGSEKAERSFVIRAEKKWRAQTLRKAFARNKRGTSPLPMILIKTTAPRPSVVSTVSRIMRAEELISEEQTKWMATNKLYLLAS
jgi:hypothetical protein